jgi:hypothetical protein
MQITLFCVPELQFGRGAPITAEANIKCSAKPSICSVTTIIWQKIGDQYFEFASSKPDTYCGRNWYVKAGPKDCESPALPFPFHTEVKGEFYYGNWAYGDSNSKAVTLYG